MRIGKIWWEGFGDIISGGQELLNFKILKFPVVQGLIEYVERDLEITCLETGSYSVPRGSLLAMFNCLRWVMVWVFFISSNALYFFSGFRTQCESWRRFSTVLSVEWFLSIKRSVKKHRKITEGCSCARRGQYQFCSANWKSLWQNCDCSLKVLQVVYL